MTLLLSKKNFLFVHIYKNAGISIKSALMPFALSPWQIPIRKLLRRMRIPWGCSGAEPFHSHIKASEMIESMGLEEFRSFFTFAIVRNPWDWQVSLYSFMRRVKKHYQHDLVMNLGSFDEYIRWRCENEISYQKDFIYSKEGELLVDYVGRYENLDADFNTICSRIGIVASLPRLNVSNTTPYQEFYSDESRELVRQAFKPDIELFQYDF